MLYNNTRARRDGIKSPVFVERKNLPNITLVFQRRFLFRFYRSYMAAREKEASTDGIFMNTNETKCSNYKLLWLDVFKFEKHIARMSADAPTWKFLMFSSEYVPLGALFLVVVIAATEVLTSIWPTIERGRGRERGGANHYDSIIQRRRKGGGGQNR